MLRSLDRTIYRLEQAKIAMPKGYCNEPGCLNPNTRNGTCSRHDRTPLKLERDQPGVYCGEYRGCRVRIERRAVYRGWRAAVADKPIVCACDTLKMAREIIVDRIDMWLDHKVAA